MHLAIRLNLYRAATLSVPVDLVQAADDLGYHSVWTAEAYGADALSPLAYLAGFTRRIKLGTSIAQLAARPPATLAMHAMTIDALAGGGRVIIGIGVSGPQIVEGWYGQPWGHPTPRLRDYVAIVRKVLDREGPVNHDGTELSLPYRGPGATGEGKALRSILHPTSRIPIWLASGGPRNTELCAEVADGWLPMGLGAGNRVPALERGWSDRGGRPPGFEIFSNASVEITDDVAGALDRRRPLTAMYVGGMGSETHNFHKEAMARRGFPDEAQRIQDLWLAGKKDEAVEAVPDAYLEQSLYVGDEQRIRRRWAEQEPVGLATGLILDVPGVEELRLIADLRDG
ncbi:MAG TPA: LLM class flavin-dependent oxidoreductase [Acidimicrobiales bacterium]|jgi:F420-dependent oxidoreductase-like protein|nr:LLM class flavin-dependent oxidoreductase [Acidimicrobiales bacterium]